MNHPDKHNQDNLSISDSMLYGDDPDISIIPSPPDSLPTFQMFREKKIKVEGEMKYHYRWLLHFLIFQIQPAHFSSGV